MPSFGIFETNQFQKDLAEDFRGQAAKVKTKLLLFVYPQLKHNSFFGKNIKKLKGYKPETWRYRISDYRFFYTIDDKKKIVFMISADDRQGAY